MSRIFGEIRQIALVVKDIGDAMDYWANTLGIGPFFIKREIEFSDYIYRGKALASPKISIALSNSGYIQVELIQQHDNLPSIYKEFTESGREGLQHVAAWFDKKDFDLKKQQLINQGCQIVQQCTIASSGVRLIYFATDTTAGGVVFEIADLLEPGQLERIKNIANVSANWSGEYTSIEVTK